MANKKSKRYRDIEKVSGEFPLMEALEKVKGQKAAKFDETLDLSFHLNLLKKHTVRDTVVFPSGFGATKKVLVFAKGKKAEEAMEAGADHVGGVEMVEKIEKGWLDFEVAIATPDMMRDIAKVARILGSRGLMPSPKAKTVTLDVAQAVKAVKAGRREFRANADGVVNFPIGKKSMENDSLFANAKEFYEVLLRKKPMDLKGDYIKSISVSSTMGKGVRVNKRAVLSKG